jgi:ribosomal-protein-alanine N-acetyltransferase
MKQEKFNRDLSECVSIRIAKSQCFVEIKTKRLRIRSYHELDFENCVELYGHDLITKYFDHGKPRSRDEVEQLISSKVDKYFYSKKPFGIFSVFPLDGINFLGQIDFVPTEEKGSFEIGFIFHRKYHNQGFCSEAVNAIIYNYTKVLNSINDCWEELPVNKIIATVHPENYASLRVIEKAGLNLDKIQSRFGQPRLWYSIPINYTNSSQELVFNA